MNKALFQYLYTVKFYLFLLFDYASVPAMFRLSQKFYIYFFLLAIPYFVEASICESVFSKKLEKKTLQVQKIFEALPLKLGKIHKIPKKAQVIHIPQIHYVKPSLIHSNEYRQFTAENTIRSQLSIAKIIMANIKDNIFVSEVLTKQTLSNMDSDDLNYDDGRPSINKKIVEQNVRSDFYKKDFEELTKEEKEFLSMHTATSLLFFLGHIKTVHSFIPKAERDKLTHQKIVEEISKIETRIREMIDEKKDLLEIGKIEEAQRIEEIINQLNAKQYLIMMNQRASLLKDQVGMLQEKYPNKKIFIVFGFAHDFSYLFKDVSFYKVPNSVTLPEQYSSHLDHAMILLRTTSQRFNIALSESEGSISKKEIQDFVKDYKRAYKIMMDYSKNKDKYPVSFSLLTRERHLIDEEIKSKVEEVKLKIHELEALL